MRNGRVYYEIFSRVGFMVIGKRNIQPYFSYSGRMLVLPAIL